MILGFCLLAYLNFFVFFAICITGDTLGSFVYVPCEVMKQRMQVQGTKKSWSSVVVNGTGLTRPCPQMYGYYAGMFQAGCSIWKQQGLKGLYAGYILKLNPLLIL